MTDSTSFGRVAQGAVALAVAGLLAAGCQSHPRQSKRPLPENSQLAIQRPTTQPAMALVAPPQLNTADVLTARINAYAKELGPLADQRPKIESSATQPAAERSQVQWAQPAGTGPIKLPTKQPEPRVVPMPNPVVENEPSVANAQASITDKAVPVVMTQGPMRIAPESLNHPTAVPAQIAADLEAKLGKRLQDSPREVWAHLDYQLLQFLRDEPVPQLDSLTSLPMEDRELLSVVLDGLTNFRNGLRADNNMQASRKVKPLLELAERLRSQADLNITSVALCSSVESYGHYTPMEARFLAGKEHEAILYCEVENFSSTSLPEKMEWETRLTQEATLYTESGLPVTVDKPVSVIDHSRSHRHDFYVIKRMHLPANLTIGRYLLKVTVEDQQAKRVAEQTVPLEIVAELEKPVAEK